MRDRWVRVGGLVAYVSEGTSGRNAEFSPGTVGSTLDRAQRCLSNVEVLRGRTLHDVSSVREIGQFVEEIRGREFDRLPEVIYVTPAEMAVVVERSIKAGYPDEEAQADDAALHRLGALPSFFELKDTTGRLMGSHVAGYYDSPSGSVVVLRIPGFTVAPRVRIALAHEFVHALPDQFLGLPVQRWP